MCLRLKMRWSGLTKTKGELKRKPHSMLRVGQIERQFECAAFSIAMLTLRVLSYSQTSISVRGSNVCLCFDVAFALCVMQYIIIIIPFLALLSLWLCGWVSAYVYFSLLLLLLLVPLLSLFFCSLSWSAFLSFVIFIIYGSLFIDWSKYFSPNAIGFKCHCLVSISIRFSHFSFSTFFAFLSVLLFLFFSIYQTTIQDDISSSMANKRIVQIYICKFFHTNKTIAM